jgi:hypothetical protein
MKITLDPNSVADYRTFLKLKSLPQYRVVGRCVEFPDEYSHLIGTGKPKSYGVRYVPSPFCFDYQAGVAEIAIRRKKFGVFARCGLGKTIIMFEYARYAREEVGPSKGTLIVSPLMVIPQTIEECQRWYGDSLPIEYVPSGSLNEWLATCGGKIGITNYEAFRNPINRGQLGVLCLDESSGLRAQYGTYSQGAIDLGVGLDWKLSLTGTPAPNDRIEFANQAVFLDQFPNQNAFLAKFFVNRGQTGERWELRRHALRPFYRSLSHWSIFLDSPSVYGWKDNTDTLPPIHVHIHDVPLTDEQKALAQKLTGQLVPTKSGGIKSRGKLGQLAKGQWKGKAIDSNKPEFIADLVKSWPDESTLVWCLYDAEQDRNHATINGSESMDGDTKHDERLAMIRRFKNRETKTLISKPKILGYGLNLQVCTRMVFSALQDSYEQYWQAIARANRVGSTLDLNVHIPVTEIEVPMVESVLAKAGRIAQDTAEQEAMFSREFLDVTHG